ncbi:divergent PAP2 family protein [Tichowtungia aerotolerans]|uniref:Divergent PAP2 family protein n=1 Tax=Tichowtungia aerotolerans TaxID=2697043 RepID=A0A6P1MBD4_9BACT|nr:divergent PAP2 family protein [Tichowtungia aerotolerans]QHI68876.1 divergent PAP2 family protein [Tichowtungia aerotolerans]
MEVLHISFWAGLAGWLVAQLTKMLICLIQSRRLDFRYLASTGGMPSAHSSLVSALTTAIVLTDGFNSPLFAISVVFASVVMFDAQTVRAAAGKQARLLNQIVDELFQEHHLSETKLKELLGHTRLEVFFGMLTGIATALAVFRFIPHG